MVVKHCEKEDINWRVLKKRSDSIRARRCSKRYANKIAANQG